MLPYLPLHCSWRDCSEVTVFCGPQRRSAAIVLVMWYFLPSVSLPGVDMVYFTQSKQFIKRLLSSTFSFGTDFGLLLVWNRKTWKKQAEVIFLALGENSLEYLYLRIKTFIGKHVLCWRRKPFFLIMVWSSFITHVIKTCLLCCSFQDEASNVLI